MSERSPGLGAAALALACFMSVLDLSTVNVALPAISGDLGVSAQQGSWMVTSYAIAAAISLPLTGWMVLRFGPKPLFFGAVSLFTVGSLLCALAPSMETLLAARVLHGFSAGPLMPLAQALLLRIYSRNRMGFALSVLSVATLSAAAVGPLFAGWLSDNASWRWIFLANVPMGLACAAGAAGALPRLEISRNRGAVDATGFLLLAVWVGSLQAMLDLGRHRGWFDSPSIAALGIASVVFFFSFLMWEKHDAEPIVDLDVFRDRLFSAGALTFALGYGLLLGNLVLLPLWLIHHLGYPATWAGLVLAPVGILSVVVAPFVGRHVDRHDPRIAATGAFLAMALSLGLRSWHSSETDVVSLMIPSVVQGAGTAMFFTPMLAVLLARVPDNRIAAASGIAQFLRFTCGALVTSVMITAWDWRSAAHRGRLVETLFEGNLPLEQARVALEGVGAQPMQQIGIIERWVDQQAYTLALTELFGASAMLFLFLALLMWAATYRAGVLPCERSSTRRAPGERCALT